MQEIKGKTILILGYGQEGKSTTAFLKKNYPEISLTIADQKEIPSVETEGLPTITGENYLNSLDQFDTVIRSPGIPWRTEQIQTYIKNGGNLTSATNIFFSLYKGTIVGITGTKGKTTTTHLIYEILKNTMSDVRLVGNMRRPMLDNLEGQTTQTIFVAELSNHMLEDIHYSPHIAVLLEIVPEHLLHHGSFENYVKAKNGIFAFQTPDDYAIFNPHHEPSATLGQIALSQKKYFSPTPTTTENLTAYIKDETVFLNDTPLLKTTEIPLLGKGNQENVLAAATAASLFNINPLSLKKTISVFKPIEHRIEPIGTYHQITFYNDSIATTPEAAINAIEALEPNVETLIVGGYDRGLDYKTLTEKIAHSSLKTVILLPTTGNRIADEIKRLTTAVTLLPASSLEEAVHRAYENTTPGKTVLLSPAAASYNMFKDFEDRGNKFKELVKNYTK